MNVDQFQHTSNNKQQIHNNGIPLPLPHDPEQGESPPCDPDVNASKRVKDRRSEKGTHKHINTQENGSDPPLVSPSVVRIHGNQREGNKLHKQMKKSSTCGIPFHPFYIANEKQGTRSPVIP